MIEFERALKLVLNNTKGLSRESVPIEDSVGRVLMEDVYSKIDMPPFNKSAMDGYAVKALDIKKIPVKLKCIGFIEAGGSFCKTLRRGECVKIMTGASLPKGADSIVMIEDTRHRGGYIEIKRPIKRWKNVCFQGEDIKKGEKVLTKKKVLSVSDIALLASIGRRYAEVVRKPEVGVLNTGGEIVPVGRKLSGKKIYNSNGPQLLALLESDGIDPCFLGIAKDDPQELRKAIKRGLRADALLVSGGVSMGDYDLVPGVLKSLGVREVFHKVKIKPGKPLFFGRRKNTVVFGIPGNPVSNFLAYYMFIRPALSKMRGMGLCGPLPEEGILKKAFHHKGGRKHFVLSKISREAHQPYVTPIASHGSADTLALSKADAFMVVEANTGIMKAKSKIKFITWKIEKK